jgi:hypothetical protein
MQRELPNRFSRPASQPTPVIITNSELVKDALRQYADRVAVQPEVHKLPPQSVTQSVKDARRQDADRVVVQVEVRKLREPLVKDARWQYTDRVAAQSQRGASV